MDEWRSIPDPGLRRGGSRLGSGHLSLIRLKEASDPISEWPNRPYWPKPPAPARATASLAAASIAPALASHSRCS